MKKKKTTLPPSSIKPRSVKSRSSPADIPPVESSSVKFPPVESVTTQVQTLVDSDMSVQSKSKKLENLLSNDRTRRTVTAVLLRGLRSVRPIVADGEIISREIDFDARLKYAKFIAEVIGETKPDTASGDFYMSVEEITSRSRRIIVMAQKVQGMSCMLPNPKSITQRKKKNRIIK